MEHTPTPWTANEQFVQGADHTTIVNTFGNYPPHERLGQIAAFAEAKANAEFLCRACNSHDALLEACEAFIEAWDKSHQLEKTDLAVRLAKAAIEAAKPPNA